MWNHNWKSRCQYALLKYMCKYRWCFSIWKVKPVQTFLKLKFQKTVSFGPIYSKINDKAPPPCPHTVVHKPVLKVTEDLHLHMTKSINHNPVDRMNISPASVCKNWNLTFLYICVGSVFFFRFRIRKTSWFGLKYLFWSPQKLLEILPQSWTTVGCLAALWLIVTPPPSPPSPDVTVNYLA